MSAFVLYFLHFGNQFFKGLPCLRQDSPCQVNWDLDLSPHFLFISYWFFIRCKRLVSCTWKALVRNKPLEVKCEKIWLWFGQGEAEDKRSSCRLVRLLCLFLCPHPPKPEVGIFQCQLAFFHYLPNTFSFHRSDLKLEGEIAAVCHEAVR